CVSACSFIDHIKAKGGFVDKDQVQEKLKWHSTLPMCLVAASEPGPSTPPPAERSKRTKAEQAAESTQPTKGEGKGKGKAAKAKQAPQPGSAEHAAHWGEQVAPIGDVLVANQAALPAKGKEYPGLGYKRLQDKPPKSQEPPPPQQQQQPAVAQ
ncbi:hypothetical protein QJQ45_005726, partial [Haematococcus lacustris]